MSNKNKIKDFLKKEHYTNTKFTDTFLHSFNLQISFLEGDVTDSLAREWYDVIEEIIEVMKPQLTDDIRLLKELQDVLQEIK